MNDQFKLVAVEALPDYHLKLSYADQQVFEVNLNGWIAETKALHPLKAPELFAQVKLIEYGFGVYWIEDELDLGADNLRNLAIEQLGGIGHERIWNWLYAA